jgi:chitodextrinase
MIGKSIKHIVIYRLGLLFILFYLPSNNIISQPIIADHTFVDAYTSIPQQYIDSVKKKWLSYAGESHSEAIRVGLEDLQAIDSKFAVNVTEGETPETATSEHLRVSRGTWGDLDNPDGWHYSYGEEDWWSNETGRQRTRDGIKYCNENGFQLDYFAFGWCYDATSGNTLAGDFDPVYFTRWGGKTEYGPDGDLRWGLDADDETLTGNSDCLDTYLDATTAYINYCQTNNYPTKVFFTTGPVDNESDYAIGETGYQQYLKWQRIRDYVNTTNYTLFDYADILSYNDAGVKSTTSWTNYNDELKTFPMIHPDNLNGDDVAHIGSVGALRLAKAMWVLLAIEEGWDGGPTVDDNISPSVPQNLDAIVASATSINLSWSASTDNIGVAGYRVYRDGSLITTVTALSYSDNSLDPETEYQYQVSAIDDSANESNLSDPVFETTPASTDEESPTIPTGLQAEAVSSTQINLSWNASTDNVGVTGYKIYRNTTFTATTSDLNYSDNGLSQNTEYQYQVSAIDDSANESNLSDPVFETTPASTDEESPTIPTGLQAEAVSSTQINLSWGASSDNTGVAGYKIYRDDSFVGLSDSLSYYDTGLITGNTYVYNVSAFDTSGNESDQSSEITILLELDNISYPISEDFSFRIYPNPAKDGFTIDLPEKEGEVFVDIYSTSGLLLFHKHVFATNSQLTINDLNLTDNLYLIKVSQNSHSANSKILLTK